MSKTSKELIGNRLVAKVKLHNYRFPKSGHNSGDFAIVIFDVIRIVEGQIPLECELKGEPGKFKITVTGKLPKIDEKSEYIFQGTLHIDREWGEQYEVESIRLDYDLTREEDQRKFFSYFMTDRQIDMLYADGNNPMEYLEQKNIGELTKIKGIGPATAARMCKRYEECKNNSRAYVALKALDLSKNVIDRLIRHYGSADIVVEKIESNPYILISEVRGIGWKKADDLAKRQGLTNNCKERVIAYTRYYLETQADMNGNTWILVDDLLTNVQAECQPITKEQVGDWLKEFMVGAIDFERYYERHSEGKLTVEEMPFLFYDKITRRVSLTDLRMLEKDIAFELHRLASSNVKMKYDKKLCEEIIKECEKEQGFEYTDEQVKAIWNILDNNVAVLTGSGGTGKSSTLKPLVRILSHYNQEVSQCALSGRASSLLSDYTGIEGKTIHRTLCFMPDSDRFRYTKNNPLPDDVVILDETSMVGGYLFLSLISAIRTGAKFIMLGDTQQLESIGICNILKDCISSGYINVNILTKIHRQAAMSGIITQAIQVSNGESIVKNDFSGEEVRGELRDFKLIGKYDTSLIQQQIIKEFKHLYFDCHLSLDDIQIIVPMKTRGDLSCRVLNQLIQEIVNPVKTKDDVTLTLVENGVKYQVCFRPKDKIIVVKNNYHAPGLDGSDKQIFNGNIGYIKDINDEVMIATIGDVGDVVLPKDQWDCIQHAYAITVHKKQGDSVPYAIIGLDTSAYALLSKELLYTAITRASKYCTLIVQPRAANIAVKTSRVKIKQTWLKDDLLKYAIEEGLAS